MGMVKKVTRKSATPKGLAAAAPTISRRTMCEKQVVRPQPGQGRPVVSRKPQGGRPSCVWVPWPAGSGFSVVAVITTASGRNADRLRELGADEVVDYTTTDFAETLSGLDLVFDTIGGAVHARSKAVLKPGGKVVFVAADPIPEDEGGREDVDAINVRVGGGRAAFERLGALLGQGVMTPWVETVMPLDDARAAYDLSQSGHARGKIVLTMG